MLSIFTFDKSLFKKRLIPRYKVDGVVTGAVTSLLHVQEKTSDLLAIQLHPKDEIT